MFHRKNKEHFFGLFDYTPGDPMLFLGDKDTELACYSICSSSFFH